MRLSKSIFLIKFQREELHYGHLFFKCYRFFNRPGLLRVLFPSSHFSRHFMIDGLALRRRSGGKRCGNVISHTITTLL